MKLIVLLKALDSNAYTALYCTYVVTYEGENCSASKNKESGEVVACLRNEKLMHV